MPRRTQPKAGKARKRPAKQKRSKLKPDEHGLTERERVIADAYLLDPDRDRVKAYQAWNPKVTRASARSAFGKLLAAPAFRDYVAKREAELRATADRLYGITSDRVLEEVASLAFIDPLMLFDDHGRLLPIREMPERARRALQSMDLDVVTNSDGDIVRETRKLRFHDKGQQLDRLMKHLGLFERDNQQRQGGDEERLARMEHLLAKAALP